MSVQYAAALGNTTPYIRLLKFVEGVGETIPLPFTSPVALSSAAFSPDGEILIAAKTATGTSTLIVWGRSGDDVTEADWIELGVIDLPSAKAVYDLAFLNNSELVIAADSQTWVMTLDRTPLAGTFVSVSTYTTSGGQARITVITPTFFTIARLAATSAPAGLGNFYKSSGTWQGVTINGQSYNNSGVTVGDGKAIYGRVAGANNAHMNFAYNLGVLPPAQVSSGFVAPLATDTVTGTGTAGDTIAPVAKTPDNELVLIPDFTSPFMALRRIFNIRTPAYIVNPASAQYPVSTGPEFPTTLPAKVNWMGSLADDLILLAVNSNVVTTGRVRGWKYDGKEIGFTEDTAVSALFSDWSTVPNYIAVGEPIASTGAPTNLYASFLTDLLNGDVDLTNIKLLVVNSSAVFNKAHTTLAAAVGANEVYGSSWPQGGVAVNDMTITASGSDGNASLNFSFPSTPLNDPGTFTFRSFILYDDADADKRPIAFIRFSEDKTVVQYDSMNFTGDNGRLALFTPEA